MIIMGYGFRGEIVFVYFFGVVFVWCFVVFVDIFGFVFLVVYIGIIGLEGC